MPPELPPQYNPKDVESAINERWQAANAYHAEPTPRAEQREAPDQPPYSIVIPPPNVTAPLHLGHALNNTLQDVLIRWRRMAGDNAMWMPGTDHAGIATQTVVEKRVLLEEGKKRTDFERDAFIEKIQVWKDEYEQRITDQLKEMGCSCDWDRQRFTMDETCAKAVREAFFRLFKDGLIYRGKRLVNWDPATQTALADDEVEMQEIDGNFYYMRYPLIGPPLANGENYVTVATTRPETMLGDTAVAINPKDPRAAELRGRMVLLPIVNREIPVIEDDYVVLPDPEGDDPKARYASGFLKVTPAHDPNDYEIGQRHDLAQINVMAPDGSISKDHGWPEEEWAEGSTNEAAFLLGKDRFEARKLVVMFFKDHEMMGEIKPYRHAVGHSYRSHVPIEPYLSDQWYVKVTDDKLRGAALRALAEDQRSDSDVLTSRDRQGAGPSSQPTTVNHYLITFTTYGSWLHGDEKGSADRDHNLPGTPYLPPNEPLERHEDDQLSGPPQSLDERQRPVVRDTLLEVCDHRGWTLLAANVRTSHVHAVVAAAAVPEKVMNDFKSYATRRLTEAGLHTRSDKLWTRHGSTRYLNDELSLMAAKRYVMEEQGEDLGGAASGDAHGSTGPLPHGRGSFKTEDWEGGLRFYPERYAKTYETWLDNLRDWCISRQLWWGHRIPVWSSIIPDALGGEVDDLRSDGSVSSRLQKTIDAHTGFFRCCGVEGDVCIRPEKDAIQTWLNLCARTEKAERAVTLLNTVYTSQTPETSEFAADAIAAAQEVVDGLEAPYRQDPDVLDTWFSSALWPLSTMGWPEVDGNDVLAKWNPTNVLCTAREIITLWVVRMVQFNLYFHGRLPFKDVFIHAMIQDGFGQKMSKSLGNGVDPMDLIHSHGADAMRFTLASMTTHTQDVRMPVDIVDPETGETVHPEFITTKAGHKVAAPVQEHDGRKMVSSYGVASGEARPTTEMPLARNTSEKFDLGQRFANKMWNAVRFSLENLSAPSPSGRGWTGEAGPGEGARGREGQSDDAPQPQAPSPQPSPGGRGSQGLADRWVLSRLARTIRSTDEALRNYEFANYANGLYDFFWRDLCDWYLEAIKPTVRENPAQQRVLATCIDASLRVLHPAMPFITERLWEALNQAYPERGVEGLALPANDLLIKAPWPAAGDALVDEDAEKQFELIQQIVGAIREVRTTYKVPPRQPLETTAKAPSHLSQVLLENRSITRTLANTVPRGVGPGTERPDGAAVAIVGHIEVYIHNLVDTGEERVRLEKRAAELDKQIANFRGRLSNEKYVAKAPAKLVQETRDQLAAAEAEAKAVATQLAAL